MNFYVYHGFTLGLVNVLCHNISDRKVDEVGKKVSGLYNGVDVCFYFDFNRKTSDLDDEAISSGYHIICREDAVQKIFFLPDMNRYQKEFNFPECLKHEYSLLNSELHQEGKHETGYIWLLFWNFGENKFAHLGYDFLDTDEEFKNLGTLVNNTIFFSDNYIHEDTRYSKIVNPRKLNKTLTNDIFMWNYHAQIAWANEFKNIFKYLNPPHKLCVSFRSPKPHRIEICKKLGSKNLKDVYISYSSSFFEKRKGEKDPNGIEYDNTYHTLKNIKNLNINKIGKDSETDLENLEASGNRKDSRFEIDFYFRILYQGKLQLLDETHAYETNSHTPINLSEKTYILLLANIPFISTHHYPFDIIQEHILDVEYPYYIEIKDARNNTDKLVSFIEKLIENFDEMYPKIKEWTNLVHQELQRRLREENSFLEHMTGKNLTLKTHFLN